MLPLGVYRTGAGQCTPQARTGCVQQGEVGLMQPVLGGWWQLLGCAPHRDTSSCLHPGTQLMAGTEDHTYAKLTVSHLCLVPEVAVGGQAAILPSSSSPQGEDG